MVIVVTCISLYSFINQPVMVPNMCAKFQPCTFTVLELKLKYDNRKKEHSVSHNMPSMY